MYKALIRPLLFLICPEKIHHLIIFVFKILYKIPGFNSILRLIYEIKDERLEREIFGIKFKNPVGLAAGFDKNAEIYDEFSGFGFSYIEVGTVTPKAQPGNDKPRLFRLTKNTALLNRMGFNNQGLDRMIKNLKKRRSDIVICGNIGKNKITPNEKATEDYKTCFNALFPFVDFFVVNVSSPNTPNLRELQDKEPLLKILYALMTLNTLRVRPKPILLKIAPDLSDSQLDDIISIVKESKISGIVATNTTISRENLSYNNDYIESLGNGGISGLPLKDKSTKIISYINTKSNGSVPIIASGGIITPQDAIEKLKAGAQLVQIYTGFIYEGPGLVKRINKAILESIKV